jgi:spermidine/putrescine transport system substrate-binding protein
MREGLGETAKNAFDRRSLLKRGAAVGVGLYGAGGGLTVLSTRLSPKALTPDGDLQFFNWAQYMNPAIIKGFEKEYKVKVQQTYFSNMQGMLAKLRAGVKYDVTFPEADYADQLVAAKYLLPLDDSKIPNLQYVAKPFQNPWYDAGAKYSVPYAIWTTGIFWNKKLLGPMTGSWNDLWNNTAKTKGKLWLLDDMKEVIGMSLIRDGKPISSTQSGDVQTAASNVLKLKSSVRGFTSVADQVKSGQSVMSHLWSGTSFQALLALKSPTDWQYEVGKEGVPVGSDTMVIPKNAPHPNTAMLFVNWMLAPENSAANPPYIGYPMMTNAGISAYAKLVKKYPWLKITVPEVEKGQHFTPLSGSALSLYSAQWAKIKA